MDHSIEGILEHYKKTDKDLIHTDFERGLYQGHKRIFYAWTSIRTKVRQGAKRSEKQIMRAER